MANVNDVGAAPPDDGHLGSFTRPEDTFQTRSSPDQRLPELNVDKAREGHGGSVVILLLAVALVLIVVVATLAAGL